MAKTNGCTCDGSRFVTQPPWRFQHKPWTGNYKRCDDLEPILETDESLTTEDQSHVRREKRGGEQQSERMDRGPQDEIDKFLDQTSRDAVLDDDEDGLRNKGANDERVPEVPVSNEAEKQTEMFQEQRGRKKKQSAEVADGSRITSRTRSHSPLLALLHSNTDSHFPLGSSVATYPLFTIQALTKPGIIERVKKGIRSGKEAVVCFSSQLAYAMSE